MDSTSQTGHNGADWQEEIYLKIQAYREADLAELQEFHLKISRRYQEEEMLPPAKRHVNFDNVKSYILLVERMIAFLQTSKSNITIEFKDKLPLYEKHIGLLTSFRRRGKQQLQHPVGHAQSTAQHQPSQFLQVQQHENYGIRAYQLNLPDSVTTVQSAVTSGMQHGSMTTPTSAAPASRLQKILSSLPFNWIGSK